MRDRIDIVVKALHFNSRFLKELLTRIEENIKPEEVVPKEIIFNESELDQAYQEMLEVKLSESLRRRMEFFSSHFEFCDGAAEQVEYKTKDTVKLAALDFNLIPQDTGKDRVKDLGSQTRNGLSVRALMTVLVFAKAMAWFRGKLEVEFEDV